MKIAIYGISRSGKNYLIEKILNRLNAKSTTKAYHLEGSVSLNRMANLEYNAPFRSLNKIQKNKLRKRFTDLIKQKESEYDVVLVDGHYAFLKDEGFNVVFTDGDRTAYDAFFYLDTPAEMILHFSRSSTGDKKNTSITLNEIREWKSFEKNRLGEICQNMGKELIILDEDTSSCVDFIESYSDAQSRKRYTPNLVAKTIINSLPTNLHDHNHVLLLDCDKTLSENDVTYIFCKHLGIEGAELNKIFHNDRYTTYQFYKVAKLYSSKSITDIEYAAQKARQHLKLNPTILDDIKDDSSEHFKIGITSGVYPIWELVEDQPFDFLVGCSDIHSANRLITPLVKKEVAARLKEMGKAVIAVGDSVIDIPMLETASTGLIIAHEKHSTAVENYFKRIPNSKIKQLSYSKYKYLDVKVVEKII